MNKTLPILLLAFSISTTLLSQEIVTRGTISGTRYSNVTYKTGSTYENERCKLDIYIPRNIGSAPYPVVVYFHGGGLNSGDKTEGWADWSNNFGYKFLENGVAMVMVNYRLSGVQGTRWPAYIQDAASSVAWVANNIQNYGGDPNKVFVMGFSAGAYLSHMLNIDPKWFNDISFDRNRIRGYIPISGQTKSHGTVAADLGIAANQLMTQRPDAMPMGHVRKTEKPMHMFVGEYEGQTITDNYDFYNALVNQGSADLSIYTNPGKDHGGMRDGLGDPASPTRTRIINFINSFASCSAITLPATLQAEKYCSMSGVRSEFTSDSGGGLDIGYIETNDYMTYNVNVTSAGTYTVQYRVASLNGGGNIRLERAGGGTVFGTRTVGATGGWQIWQTVSHNVQLPAGQQQIAIVAATGGFNINWFSLAPVNTNPNLALNRPVTTSSNENTTNIGAKAVDGNGTTRWSSVYANNQNFVVDLGANYNVNRVRIVWESAYARDYQIQFSTNNVNWTTVRERWGKTSAAADDQTGITGVARYVKIYCINRATAYGFSFFEFEVYGTSAGRMATQPDNEISDETMLNAFPNPAISKATVELNLPEDAETDIVLSNSLGTKVNDIHHGQLSAGTHHFEMNTDQLAEGIYFYRATFSGRNVVKKLMIQK